MEVRIGVQNAARELSIDTTLDADGVQDAVAEALRDGGLLSLVDNKGRRVIVPAEKLAYVDITAGTLGTVGFRG